MTDDFLHIHLFYLKKSERYFEIDVEIGVICLFGPIWFLKNLKVHGFLRI